MGKTGGGYVQQLEGNIEPGRRLVLPQPPIHMHEARAGPEGLAGGRGGSVQDRWGDKRRLCCLRWLFGAAGKKKLAPRSGRRRGAATRAAARVARRSQPLAPHSFSTTRSLALRLRALAACSSADGASGRRVMSLMLASGCAASKGRQYEGSTSSLGAMPAGGVGGAAGGGGEAGGSVLQAAAAACACKTAFPQHCSSPAPSCKTARPQLNPAAHPRRRGRPT